MIPEHDSIEQIMATTNKNISLLVEELTRVRGNIAHVPNDISVNERITGVKAFSMFPVKILAIIFIGGIFISGFYMVAVVTYDLIKGKFSGIEEASFHKDFFDMVGVIPHEHAPFSPEQRKIIKNEMFYRFILRLKDTRTIFSCSLDGSFLSSVLFDEQFSKARRNTVLIRLIPESSAEKVCAFDFVCK